MTSGLAALHAMETQRQTEGRPTTTTISPARSPSKPPKSPVLRALRRLYKKDGGPTHEKTASESRTESHGDVSPNSLAVRRHQRREMVERRPVLTEEQLRLVIDSWDLLQLHLEEVGTEMFVRLFASYPDVKGAFGAFKKLSIEDVRLSKEVRAHGQRVLATVGHVLDQQTDVDSMIKHLHDLGSKHVTFNVKVDYLDMMGQHFLFAIEPVLKDHWTPEVEQAWADLYRLIVHVMKEAMIM